MGWPANPLVYEINTRVWLRELETAAGGRLGLGAVADDTLDAIAALGFDAVWLMGVWTTGPRAVVVARTEPSLQAEYRRALPDFVPEDVLGSPYAVTRYEVSPRLGGPAGLAILRERLRARGLRLVLDFVPNHLACDHPATVATPNAFVRGTADDHAREPESFFRTAAGDVIAHGRDPYFAAWTDTAQVDVTAPAGRALLLAELQSVAAQCDGVRCDMAMLLLPDVFARTWGRRAAGALALRSFWGETIARLRETTPDLLFVAECYWGLEQRLLEEGFDFTYDKILYDRLRDGDAVTVRAHLAGDPSFQARCLRFVENHDEPRAVVAFGRDGARSAAVATLTAPGLRLVHEGQEDGRRVRVPVQLGRRPQEPVDEEIRDLYVRLLAFLARKEVKEGRWRLLEVHPCDGDEDGHRHLLAYAWEDDWSSATALVVVNVGLRRAWGRVLVRGLSGTSWLLHDRMDDARYARDGEEMREPGLFVALDPHRAHLFDLLPAGTSA